jgi:putative membrane protein
LALQLKSRLLENESLQQEAEEEVVSSKETELKGIDSKPFKNKFFESVKVGITSNYVKSIALLVIFFSTIYENQKFGDEKQCL